MEDYFQVKERQLHRRNGAEDFHSRLQQQERALSTTNYSENDLKTCGIPDKSLTLQLPKARTSGYARHHHQK